jgi:hypothetical protein
LQSILSKVKSLAAQSAANLASKTSRPASSAASSKRSKVLSSSDDDDDEPLSARATSSTKPHASSSSKHHSSHSSHDKKKREHDRPSPSRSRNSGALLGDAGSEVKSIGHVFLSSDRSIRDKLIAGILSRWWLVSPCCMRQFHVRSIYLSTTGTESSGRPQTTSPRWTRLGSR